MIVKELKILNELGIHARVASRLVRLARKFESSINAKKEDKEYDLKNVTCVMILNAKYGDNVTIEISGSDEVDAAKELENLFAIKFGEN